MFIPAWILVLLVLCLPGAWEFIGEMLLMLGCLLLLASPLLIFGGAYVILH